MAQNKRTKFRIESHHRYDLRAWLETNFPFLRTTLASNLGESEIKQVGERASEIYDACRSAAEIDRKSGSVYIGYYKEDWQRIREAYEKKDSRKMAEALEILLCAIDVE